MTDHTFKFAQKWLEKVKQRRNEVVTLKDLAILLGCLLWGLYAMDMPLALFPEIMQAAMETGSLASTKGWNIEAQTMNTEFWEETGKAIEAMESPFSVKQADFDADDALNIFSDAASVRHTEGHMGFLLRAALKKWLIRRQPPDFPQRISGGSRGTCLRSKKSEVMHTLDRQHRRHVCLAFAAQYKSNCKRVGCKTPRSPSEFFQIPCQTCAVGVEPS